VLRCQPGYALGICSAYSPRAGSAILDISGDQTQSLWLTDMLHHHLAIAVIFIIAGHQYHTNFGIGHSIKEMLNAKTFGTKTEGQFNLPHQGLQRHL